jgi:hypothetical protein
VRFAVRLRRQERAAQDLQRLGSSVTGIVLAASFVRTTTSLSALSAIAFFSRTESVDGAQGIFAAAERSEAPAAIASRAALTSLSVMRCSKRAISQPDIEQRQTFDITFSRCCMAVRCEIDGDRSTAGAARSSEKLSFSSGFV